MNDRPGRQKISVKYMDFFHGTKIPSKFGTPKNLIP